MYANLINQYSKEKFITPIKSITFLVGLIFSPETLDNSGEIW